MKNEAKEKKEVGCRRSRALLFSKNITVSSIIPAPPKEVQVVPHWCCCFTCYLQLAWLQLFNKLLFSNQAEDLLRREKNLEEAKKVVIKNDPSLPEPTCVSMILCLGTWSVLGHLASTEIVLLWGGVWINSKRW